MVSHTYNFDGKWIKLAVYGSTGQSTHVSRHSHDNASTIYTHIKSTGSVAQAFGRILHDNKNDLFMSREQLSVN